MNEIDIAALLNLLGFTSGAVLYAMLLALVLRHPPHVYGDHAQASNAHASRTFAPVNRTLLATSLLGLFWNIGSLITYGFDSFGGQTSLSLLAAASFTALGFLPAVVVHSTLQERERRAPAEGAKGAGNWLKWVAYALSAFTGALQFYAALGGDANFSDAALRTLTIGYSLLLVALLFPLGGRQRGSKRALWASALAVFAVSALHLSQHNGAESWPVELIGHQASLPLALAILYQDYRFAFADLFLKRALTLLLLTALAFGLYVAIVAPLLRTAQASGGRLGTRAIGTLLGLWVATALVYPALRRLSVWFVDAVVLRRADYGELRVRLTHTISEQDSTEELMDAVCALLGPALTAAGVSWKQIDGAGGGDSVRRDGEHVSLSERAAEDGSATVFVPTAEPPFYAVRVGRLAGGRRLLSDDIALLETAAIAAARRLDALRVIHERCEQGLREQEISKLATEAQLRALRAQLNPHFLFNALTTVGYLIGESPERALHTLLKLTGLLRRVLQTTGEFVTLGEELDVVESYLDIERQRFEERLRVHIDVPAELLHLHIPSLLIQPLIENAIKHGIAPARAGGEVSVSARLADAEDGDASQLALGGQRLSFLKIVVRNTGIGASDIELARGRRRGVGLTNIEERLRGYCGAAASLSISSARESGATVEIKLPVSANGVGKKAGALSIARASTPASSVAAAAGNRRQA